MEFRYGLPKPGGSAEIDEKGRITENPSPDSEKTPVRARNEMPPAIMKISEDTEVRLKQWLDQWILDLESTYSDLQDDWANHETAYRARAPETLSFEPFKGASRDVVPVGAMHVDPIHARLDIGIFKQDPVFTFKGLRKDVVPLMPAVQAFVDKYQKSYLKLRKVASPRILECTKLGTMILKVIYDRDEFEVLRYSSDFKEIQRVPQVRFAGPRVLGIHLGDCMFPPFYEDANDCPIIVERQRTTYEKLKELEAAGKLANVEAVRSQTKIGERTKVEDAREQAGKHALRSMYENEVKVYEIWCDFSLDPNKRTPDHLIITYERDTRTFLQLRLNWYFHQRKPYVIIPFTITNDSMLGLGVMEMLKPIQDAITAWQRMAQDNAYLANIRMFIAKKNSGIEQVPRLYSGKTFFVDDPTKDFIPFASFDIYPSTLAERQNLFGLAEKRTGVSDYLQGRESPIIGTRATATATLALIKEGTQRVEEILENQRAGWAEVMQFLVSIWIQYGTGGLEDLLFDDDEIASNVKKFFALLNEQNVNGAFAVDLTVTDASTNRQAQQQMQLSLIQVMMQYLEKLIQLGADALMAAKQGMPEYAEMAKEVMAAARVMFKDLIQKYDIRNWEEYLPDLARFLQNGQPGPTPATGQGSGGDAEGRAGGPEGQSRLPVGSGPARSPTPTRPATPGQGGGHPVLAEASRAG
jgi:hypothetical protein